MQFVQAPLFFGRAARGVEIKYENVSEKLLVTIFGKVSEYQYRKLFGKYFLIHCT